MQFESLIVSCEGLYFSHSVTHHATILVMDLNMLSKRLLNDMTDIYEVVEHLLLFIAAYWRDSSVRDHQGALNTK